MPLAGTQLQPEPHQTGKQDLTFQPLPGLCRTVYLSLVSLWPVCLFVSVCFIVFVPLPLDLFLSRLLAFSYSSSDSSMLYLLPVSTTLSLAANLLLLYFWSAAVSEFASSPTQGLAYNLVSLCLWVSVPRPRFDSISPSSPRRPYRHPPLATVPASVFPPEHPPKTSPHPLGLSDRPRFVSCVSAPRPAASGVSAALCRPLSAWVFPPTPFPGSVFGSLCLSWPGCLALSANPTDRRRWLETATIRRGLRPSSPSSDPGGIRLIPPSSGHRPRLRVALAAARGRLLATELGSTRRPQQACSSSKVLERLRAAPLFRFPSPPTAAAPGTPGAEPPPR